ncbi:MAG: hypothetical protein H6740_27195 [Alphaproteobacteria bacterium]|nr:hypothetical protein [Alphaproteobacteria bacterium]
MALFFLLLGGACYTDDCSFDSADWALDGRTFEVRDRPYNPEALVGATVEVQGELVTVRYSDTELGEVTVTYRIVATN